MATIQTGKFITLEGVDGCGKSTQAAMLAEYLEKRGYPVVLTREPGGTALGREVSRLVQTPGPEQLSPLVELTLMFAARVQHIDHVIAPALARGTHVICDRFIDSTIAYQGFGRGVPLETIQMMDQRLCGSLRPGLTLVIDVDVRLAAERTVGRNRGAGVADTRFEQEGLEFFNRVRGGYVALSHQEPGRVLFIDGSGSISVVQNVIRAAAEHYLQRP
jgi:dTMP kinase